MEWLGAPDLWFARLLYLRGVGAIYLIAFVAALNQWRALLGEHGLFPVSRFVATVPFRRSPSLFHLRHSDRFALAVCWAGAGLSVAAVLGLPERAPVAVSMLVWLAIWLAYLSIVNVGQTPYAFGWESILLEAGFLAVLLGPGWMEPPLLAILLVRWLLFRVEFGAGLIKLRGDPCWRELTCLYYHHETQPMPNPLSWFFHHLPRPLHRVEVAGNHAAQLIAPWALFLPQPIAGIGGGLIIVTQLWLVLSGNFSWLNVLTIVLAVTALPDGVLGPLVPVDRPALVAAPTWHTGLVIAVTAVVAVLSWWPVRNMASRRQAMNRSFNPLHLVNTYGAFGSITRERHEIVLEGTPDRVADRASEWRPYGFRAKPGDPMRRPPQVAPYHLRLDWLMWFAALSPRRPRPWLLRLVERLLEADAVTLALLRDDPFDGEPPRAVRAVVYRYRFTTPEERRETGAWWHRTLVGEHLPPLRRGDLR